MTEITDGAIAQANVPAAALADLIAGAQGTPIFWRVDSVVYGSFGDSAVSEGEVWTLSVISDGSPEFETPAPYINQNLKVGVFAALPPFGCLNADGGELQCRVLGGSLPAGLKLEVRDGAVHIAGVPTRAGEYDLLLSLSSRVGRSNVTRGMTRALHLVVSELGEVVGAYDGWMSGSVRGEGTAKMSVSSRGRITGRVNLDGVSWSFKAPFFNALSNDCCIANVELTRGRDESFPAILVIGADGCAEGVCVGESGVMIMARDRWREAGMPELAARYAGEYPVALPPATLTSIGGALQVRIEERGRGKVKIVGYSESGQRFTANSELVYVPGEGDDPGRVFFAVYMKGSRATDNKGLFGVFEVVHDFDGVEPNRIEDVIPLAWW